MHITLLCNAGLAITNDGATLLVDLPNENLPPFAVLKEDTWRKILNREHPYHNVCGFYFTHDHPDHCDRDKVAAYRKRWPDTACFFPEEDHESGRISIGPFDISYRRVDHAPMDVPTPPHVVTWIESGGKSLYLAADAKLDVFDHQAFLKGRRASAAFWNSMYLSRPETRSLLQSAAEQNYIYHMPEKNPDTFGIWRKCEKNCQRYAAELGNVTILAHYPWEIAI